MFFFPVFLFKEGCQFTTYHVDHIRMMNLLSSAVSLAKAVSFLPQPQATHLGTLLLALGGRLDRPGLLQHTDTNTELTRVNT